MRDLKLTKVIIRVDDVTQLNLFELADWFTKNHPDVPLCVYLIRTHLWNKNGWKKLKEMIVKYGWEVGGHTRNHPYLSSLSEDEIKLEVIGNIRDIEEGLKSVGLNYKVLSFAYPFGDFDNRVKNILREIGIKIGLTYPDGFPYDSIYSWTLDDNFEVGITQDDKPPLSVLNKRFDIIHNKRGLYILCLHTRNWRYSFIKDIKYFLKIRRPIKEIGLILLKFFKIKNKWRILDSHLKYIKNKGDVYFTTFREVFQNE